MRERAALTDRPKVIGYIVLKAAFPMQAIADGGRQLLFNTGVCTLFLSRHAAKKAVIDSEIEWPDFDGKYTIHKVKHQK